jgi:hypothetical protein
MAKFEKPQTFVQTYGILAEAGADKKFVGIDYPYPFRIRAFLADSCCFWGHVRRNGSISAEIEAGK